MDFLDFSTSVMCRNLKLLHMTDFFLQTPPVTNMRYVLTCDASPEIAFFVTDIQIWCGFPVHHNPIVDIPTPHYSIVHNPLYIESILLRELLPPTSVLSNKDVMKYYNKFFCIVGFYSAGLHTIPWDFMKHRKILRPSAAWLLVHFPLKVAFPCTAL